MHLKVDRMNLFHADFKTYTTPKMSFQSGDLIGDIQFCVHHASEKLYTYKVSSIHDAILHRMGAVQGELQDLLFLLPTLGHLLFL